MTDIALRLDSADQFDLAMDGVDLATDEGLETAIIVSLFTDARADARELPAGHTDRRGWWGDVADPQDPIGSKLWTLAREKSINAVVVRAEEYTHQALQWLVDDGVVSDIDVTAELLDRDRLAIEVSLARRTGGDVARRFEYNWQQQQTAEAA